MRVWVNCVVTWLLGCCVGFVTLSDENISRKVAFLMVELYLCTHQVTACFCVGCLLFLLSWDVILVMHYAVKCCSGKNLHPVDGQQLNSYHHLSLRYGILGQQGVWICTWLCTTHLSIAVLQLWKCGNGAGYYTLHIAKNLYVSVAVHHKSVPPYLHCTFSLCG